MKKFKSVFCPPINFRNEDAKIRARELREIEMRENPQFTLWVLKDGVLYQKTPKHYTGVINMRAAGGKWERFTPPCRETVDSFLARVNAVECNFRGGPR